MELTSFFKSKWQQIAESFFNSTEAWAGFVFQCLIFPKAFATGAQVIAPGLEVVQRKRPMCEFDQEIMARAPNESGLVQLSARFLRLASRNCRSAFSETMAAESIGRDPSGSVSGRLMR